MTGRSRRRQRPAPATLALGVAALLVGCGTEQIELRPAEVSALPSVAPPGDADAPAPTETGSPGSVPVAAPGRDGVIVPEGELSPLPEGEEGCKKIDFLFVIDNSISMRDEQSNLARSFPGFVQVMQQVLEADDFHMMVVSTSGETEELGQPTLDADECADVRGAGRRQSRSSEDCGIQGGLAYMTEDQPDLEATFACAAEVGTTGSVIEEPMTALLAAIGPDLNAAGRCNDGFLREDAILVVTVITDEEDRSDGDPEDWHRVLLGAKKGDANALVVLGLVGDNNVDGGLWGGPCSFLDADGAPRLQELVSSFGGVLGSVCTPDYTPFFQTAVGSIDSACEDFVPPVIL